jgi:hypothetical protein
MSWHPTEDDLVLHFYGEGKEDETRIDAHLGTCSACRDTWGELGETMKLVDSATVPEPPDGFERVMWARVQQSLPTAARPRASVWSVRGLLPLAGLAALAVAAIAVGRFWPSASKPAAPTASVAAATTASIGEARKSRERVLLTALDDHFGQTEMLLVEVMNTPETGRTDLGFQRDAAGDLVASSRLYRATAEENGDGRLAQMLEDLESVLVEVARGPEALNNTDLESLRARIDSQNLLFKVRVVTNQIHERQRNLSTSNEGPL